MADLHFLFLQGPRTPFFSRIAQELTALGCKTTGINFCIGDCFFWKGQNTVYYRGRLSEWPEFIAEFLQKEEVTDLVLLGEQRTYHRHAIDAAQALGVRVTVTDFGYLRPDWITLEQDGMSGNSKFPKDPQTILQLAADAPPVNFDKLYSDSFWGMALADILYDFSNLLLFFLFPHYRRPYPKDHPVIFYPAMGWRLLREKASQKHAAEQWSRLQKEQVRYFIFPLQLENDFQIVAYSPFADYAEAILKILSSFAKQADADTRLLIKAHPWEPGLKNWKKRIDCWANELGIAQRVVYVDGGDLDAMIQGSLGMVTVNSTAGIRGLQLGCPVMTLGDAIYDIAGLTFQGELDDFWQNKQIPDTNLLDAFIRAMAATIQIRGVYYQEPGLSVAVEQAVKRLYHQKVNQIMSVSDEKMV